MFQQKKKINKNLIIRSIILKEKDNILSIKDLSLSKNYKIDNIEKMNINFVDKDNLKNKVQVVKKGKNYLISGNSFNIDSIVEQILDS